MNKKRISKDRFDGLITHIVSTSKKMRSKGKLVELIGLIILASVVHELGHIVMGGGVRQFKYPGPDMLSTVIIVRNGSLISEMSGFLFTLPLLLISSFPRLMLLIFIFQSRYDLLDVASQLHLIGYHVSWSAPM